MVSTRNPGSQVQFPNPAAHLKVTSSLSTNTQELTDKSELYLQMASDVILSTMRACGLKAYGSMSVCVRTSPQHTIRILCLHRLQLFMTIYHDTHPHRQAAKSPSVDRAHEAIPSRAAKQERSAPASQARSQFAMHNDAKISAFCDVDNEVPARERDVDPKAVHAGHGSRKIAENAIESNEQRLFAVRARSTRARARESRSMYESPLQKKSLRPKFCRLPQGPWGAVDSGQGPMKPGLEGGLRILAWGLGWFRPGGFVWGLSSAQWG